MSGSTIPPVPEPKPDGYGDPAARDGQAARDETVPLCGTYEVGQIRIPAFGGFETQPNAAAPGLMKVTSVEFSYVPANPDETCLEIQLEDFSTGTGDGSSTVRIARLGLLLQSDATYWAHEDANAAFIVETRFEMSVRLQSGNKDLAPGRLYVRFHCSGEDAA